MKNERDFKQEKSIKKMRELVERLNPCIFCTRLGHIPFASRPMITAKTDDDGTLWFFSAAGSNKNVEIKMDDHIELLFGDLKNSEFLSIYGRAEILRDPEMAAELWQPGIEAWFQYGPDDPELTLIKVTPILGNYWDGKLNKMREMLKLSIAEKAGSPVGYNNDVEATLST
jgi:general stress protein 26